MIKIVKTLARSIREYKKASILTPTYVSLEVILECIIPLIMAELINNMTGDSMEPIIKYGLILFVMAMASLFCGIMSARKAATASAGFAKNLRQDVFYKIQDFSFADVDKFSTSSLVTRLTTDITNVQNAYQMVIRVAVRTPLMFIFSVAMSFSINVKMALIFVCIVPFLAIVLFGIFFKVHPIFKRIFKKYDALNNSVQENVSAIRVVKSFVREDYETKKFFKASGDVKEDFTHAEKILALNTPTMMLSMFTSILLVCFIGAQIIVNSGATSLTTGELSSLLTYGVQILTSLMMLSFVFVMVAMAAESADRIVEVLETESDLQSPVNGKTEIRDGAIDFDDVFFKYKKTSENYALTNINLHIKSGQTVGILGGTGDSKTSLIQLIPRLYDTTKGMVRVGGVDVKDYDLVALRDAVSVVLQKNVLFSGTIKENLRWGNKEATDEQIEEACRLACADEFIQGFPDKYDTYIEQGGSNVSGGQKQRLCIARALLKNPKVLIMDDSTSAVDTKTDAHIRAALAKYLPETTKIIIAQRISSVQDADVIIVLDQGKIVEKGTHDELVALGGIYSEVFESQTKSKEE